MKFGTEKKSSLCIYTQADCGSEKMECEVRALRRELEETRTALKLQTVRCRQLVAAFTTKLQEKEAEVRAGRELRDQQLGRVLRALLVLEARLRREQRHIRQQLQERDQVISSQQREIDSLKMEKREKIQVDKVVSTEPQDDPPRRPPPSYHRTPQSTAFVRFRKNFGSYRPVSRRRCYDGDSPDESGCHEDELSRDLSKDYQHNPVLECVNQILLRDQDEAEEKSKAEMNATASRYCHSIKEEEEGESSSHSHTAQEKACLLMASQRLSVVSNPEFEQLDKKQPPPLPPKPPQLGAKGLYHKKLNCARPQPAASDVTDNKRVSPDVNHNDTTLHNDSSEPAEKPRQRQILSNGSLKLALNQDSNQQPLTNGHEDSPSFRDKLDNLNLSEFRRTRPSSLKGSLEDLNHCSKIRVGSSVSSLITGSCGNSIVSELTKGELRVSQMVRRFEDLGRDSPVQEQENGDDDEEDALRRNFEEFKLEDVDMDSVSSGGEDGGRPAGDGAEARGAGGHNNNNNNNGGSYEHFLEATGLSQKSILTPSRLYSNHRSVLKPKDVKHRSRVLKGERSSAAHSGPVVKYWIEPFL